MLFHLGVFQLDTDSKHQTFWHSLTAPARLLIILILLLGVVLTPNGYWGNWLVYGLVAGRLVWISQIRLPVLLRRVALESIFLSVVLIGTLFRRDGEVVWSWGWLQVTETGLVILGSVSLKAFLSLILLNLLTMTTSIPDLLNGLLVLKTPPLLVAIMMSMYRYIDVLIKEFQAMQRAASARNFRGSNHWQRLVLGSMLGSLFIRTFDRGERIYQAMLARGYQGIPTQSVATKFTSRDKKTIIFTLILVLLEKATLLF
ncbi:MAG: cobalt ECF transporter T component CbiQ [Coleofasciculaceae cyanobacterium SM2_1_6]|nr:cobalt ECF transporter T component CbiQ [Coleofasciculaceae cyanobacterium SM2_1_6]